MITKGRWITATVVLMGAFCVAAVFAAPVFVTEFVAPGFLTAQVLQTGSGALTTRVAPGEPLPLAVRLSNFGNNLRVDVSIKYEILDSRDLLVLSQTETVAVETSASYIKQIALPGSIAPGLYTARTSIFYNGQRVPATASQQFTVERKIYGIFVSDAITGGAILFAVAVLSVLAGLLYRRQRRESLFLPHDYSNIPKEARIYYEILSDAIQQMRYHEGDRAVDIAAKTPGLDIDTTNGKVLSITQNPSQVIASIVSQYENTFGKKLNLAFA
ncbi:MAG: hypothetical protein Q7R71_00960, partial [bacterium]|nr:hypothetical protein [bacterium]